MQTSNEKATLQKHYHDLISASHILHHNNVLDAFGHISFRHPHKPSIFIMSKNAAPGTISCVDDLVEYYIEDAQPVDPNAPRGFLERCIHSECYKRYASVNSVIHSHSEAVVPYSFSGVPLRAVYHMGGFLGTRVPVWDIEDAYEQDDIQDLLVRHDHLGKSLAASFADGDIATKPEYMYPVVLMRGHGFTVLAESISDCVMRAVYTQKNAMIQSTALTTRAADPAACEAVKYLSEVEIIATKKMATLCAHRPWGLWKREVEACDLYHNSVPEPHK
jgi:ribulose-5-phosphate 4-epimerase/fuculose-1-phosphate aldolase